MTMLKDKKSVNDRTTNFWSLKAYCAMPNQKPLNVAIIGTGIFARRHLKAFEKLPDKYNLVACSNRSQDKAEKFAEAVSSAVILSPLPLEPFLFIYLLPSFLCLCLCFCF